MTETSDQYEAAIRVILDMLKLQTETPAAISKDDLPEMVRVAADERERQGDYGAARMLDEYADKLELSFLHRKD
ncbi:hypothetical protein Q0601_00785 [Paracoccus onubensis]|uniref:hypothetical protein n=1 Tax=Paracoccus onubensis TaxID=1675788 RepID=UPI0027301132|nr:hypothetical protein [Paracoccus onubensis]MDP0925697.1 hypothetical protein [Paracoccus onubensis]